MAKLTKTWAEFKFSPEGIAALCTNASVKSRLALLNALDRDWNDQETFEVEIEIPLEEHPHAHILNIAVDPITQQVTIERRVVNDRLSSCARCRLG